MSNKTNESWWSWKADEADIKNQIVNYESLKITESYRGLAVIIIAGFLIFSLILSIFGTYSDVESMIYGIIFYSIILFFVYKGHRWAIILLMVMWTFEKGYQAYGIIDSGKNSIGGIIFWWAIIMPYFWKALKVENEKIKRIKTDIKSENIQSVPINNNDTEKKHFCSKCGKEINSQVNFCKFCGNQSN